MKKILALLIILMFLTTLLPTTHSYQTIIFQPHPYRPADGNTTKFAVLIACSGGVTYERHERRDRNDIKKLTDQLQKNGWEQDNIMILMEEQATTDAILTDTFNWLDELNEDEDDLVLFFFSGHGYYHTHDAPPIDEPDGVDDLQQGESQYDDGPNQIHGQYQQMAPERSPAQPVQSHKAQDAAYEHPDGEQPTPGRLQAEAGPLQMDHVLVRGLPHPQAAVVAGGEDRILLGTEGYAGHGAEMALVDGGALAPSDADRARLVVHATGEHKVARLIKEDSGDGGPVAHGRPGSLAGLQLGPG